MNINMILMYFMRTISMVDLRTHSERIVRDLKRGERMILSYRGEPLAELVPTASSSRRLSPLEALTQVQSLLGRDSDYANRAETYLRELRADQKAWSERSP
jgi:antitoxin (DNA-binding transcriptional repressor) of toxin-antitoxin stability system